MMLSVPIRDAKHHSCSPQQPLPVPGRLRGRLAGFVRTGDDRRVRFLFLDESGKIEEQ